jgi:hypothetical protein
MVVKGEGGEGGEEGLGWLSEGPLEARSPRKLENKPAFWPNHKSQVKIVCCTPRAERDGVICRLGRGREGRGGA